MALEINTVSIRLAQTQIIKPFGMVIERGEIVTLMGPSGCGKSSLLSYISGDLLPPLAGEGRVLLEGRDVTNTAPARRHIGRLFQDDLLFPHMTIGENLLFGMPRGAADQRRTKMLAALESIELQGFETRSPGSLSGGQRQRVALMRALLAEPNAMLLDEPFNKLDDELRQSMRELVYARIRATNIPCLVVTHDKADAPAGSRVFRITRTGEVQHV